MGFRIPHFQHFPPFASIIFLSFLIFQHPPCSPAALVRPAPGERTISNAEVPLPRSPLSLAAGTVLRTGFLSVLRRTGDAEGSPPGRIPDWQVEPVPRGFSPGDARGEAPCIRKLKVSPFPPGRGSGGWGRQSKLKAGAAGDKEGKLPCGHHSSKVSRQPAGQAPASDTATAGRAGNEKTPPSPTKKPVSLLTGFPPSCIIINEKGGSVARIPPPDTRFEQFVKIRICIDNHMTVCYNSDTAEEPRRNAP